MMQQYRPPTSMLTSGPPRNKGPVGRFSVAATGAAQVVGAGSVCPSWASSLPSRLIASDIGGTVGAGFEHDGSVPAGVSSLHVYIRLLQLLYIYSVCVLNSTHVH